MIGKKIIDTLCDKNLSLYDKRVIMEELSGEAWDKDSFNYLLFSDTDFVGTYRSVVEAFLDKTYKNLQFTGLKEEIDRIKSDRRLSKKDKENLITIVDEIDMW
ncbi:hypothetical protein HK18_03145 [Commensalibacter intestini]|uniref:Uncharacterized protein n=1 Tax=Commensalibacter intestini TaxID=479936 RepID=A0A251ZSV4_9PROT|nr:hypothetical protein [Commensalibacter intestini]OUI77749.1 hypothetical protein HK18_03145 [Commensalibacter intestini]